jgi:hypothetical protein
MTKIEFVGLVWRTDDGRTFALDLDGADLDLHLSVEVPHEEMDALDFDPYRVWQTVQNRIDVDVHGRRKPDAAKLFTYRHVKDGEVPFPAFESAP